ncbi:MAG: hypothetical protein GX879_06110 [Bacteroidales bacterium]|nr:hypothetical protein [Bacteroidales bacterium]
MKLLRIYLISAFLMCTLGIFAQDSTHVAYSFNYEFVDGIYLNFNQFKNNSPIQSEAIILKNTEYDASDLFDYIENSKEISYYNELGNLNTIAVKKLWGYCKNGRPHVYFSQGFWQIPFIGSICHFVANITVYYDYNPSMYYDPYYYHRMPHGRHTTEIFQMLIDMETGVLTDFNVENVAILLQRDKDLSEEFNSLRKRKKRNMIFYYIRMYNQKHPLYMPIKN